MQLPESLQSLTFGHNFNQSLEMTRFPKALQSLTLGHNFDQPLDVYLGDGFFRSKKKGRDVYVYIKWCRWHNTSIQVKKSYWHIWYHHDIMTLYGVAVRFFRLFFDIYCFVGHPRSQAKSRQFTDVCCGLTCWKGVGWEAAMKLVLLGNSSFQLVQLHVLDMYL